MCVREYVGGSVECICVAVFNLCFASERVGCDGYKQRDKWAHIMCVNMHVRVIESKSISSRFPLLGHQNVLGTKFPTLKSASRGTKNVQLQWVP